MITITVPRALLWDYTTPPDDLLWRLQRFADFFPIYGTDRETVYALYEFKDQLKIDRETMLLIKEYYMTWKSKDGLDQRKLHINRGTKRTTPLFSPVPTLVCILPDRWYSTVCLLPPSSFLR